MDNEQAKKTIKDVLQNPFDREKYINFVSNLLNHIERRDKRYSGGEVPEAYRAHINQYWRVGKYISPDDEEMDILIIEVKSLSKLDRARTTLRNFAINRLKQFEKDYSLIAFYSKEDQGADWRFSFVKIEHEAYQDDKGKVKTRTDFTPARRYSFLVGEHENSYTAQKQLLPLLQADTSDPTLKSIEDAFSIEKVTDEFFQQYCELYLKLSEHVAKELVLQCKSDEETRQTVSRFAKKLLGQIVFLYFLQKKGWLSFCKEHALDTDNRRFMSVWFNKIKKANQNYYGDFLQYLFYDALANDRKGTEDPAWYERFDCKIPFLNGGLFEADYDWTVHAIRISNELFHNAALNKAGDIGTGILDVFDRYNFTIKEDEPLEKEVAVDPEMLGKVFENMLDVSERKSKGAFYTPREIVHYMCQESLIHYLADSVKQVPKADLEDFIRKGHLFLENDSAAMQAGQKIANGEQLTTKHRLEIPASIREHAGILDEKLKSIKICDPAIGSGAFPVGLLHEIVNARLILKAFIQDKQSVYELKRHCIEQSIYGVDIDASAIDIARLRLWLSLIVDESDYAKIEALPNLDYKIMQGNSLVEDYDGIKLFNDDFINQQDETEAEIQRLKEYQTKLQAEYFSLHKTDQLSIGKKKQLDKDLGNIAKSLKELIYSDKDKVPLYPHQVFDTISQEKVKAQQLERLHKDFFSECIPAKKAEIRQQISTLEWELIEATLKEHNQMNALEKIQALKQNNEKPFFLWKLNFPEVFKQHGGFDVVIGNPPYVQIQKFSGQDIQKAWQNQNYQTFEKTGDIYALFYEKGNRILRDNGILTFITSNKWMRANYGKSLRHYFLKQVAIHQLIDFGDSPIFKEATTYTNIMLFSKAQDNVQVKAWDVSKTYIPNASLKTMLAKAGEGFAFFNADGFVIVPEKLGHIKKRIEAVGTPLKDWNISINYGIKTGFNEAFIINGKKKDELIAKDPKSAEIIKPILRGRDIKRYQASFADLWLIDTHNGYNNESPIKIENYPVVKEYLDTHLDSLTKRQDKGVTPYNLRHCAYHQDFEKEKIIWLEMSPIPNFCYEESPVFVLNTAYILTGSSLKYLLAVLNSSVLDAYFSMISTDVRGNTRRYFKQYVEILPIPEKPNESHYFDSLVDFIKLTKGLNLKLQTAYFEQIIDGLVFELYFAEEINAANKPIVKHLGELKPITEDMTAEEKLAIIQSEFDRLYEPSHPVRNHLETLDSVEPVRIVKEALQ
ncbi:MAG: Eco57I restriction-modification methylase domain-containing protein [Methylococcaceae bacterium]